MQGGPLSLVRPRLLSKGVAEVIPLENAGAWTSASALAQQARAIRSHSLVLVWVLFIGKDEQSLEATIAERVLWQHPRYGLADDLQVKQRCKADWHEQV